MTAVVLDASALLAWLQREPGWELVRDRLAGAALATINLSEVLQKGRTRGLQVDNLPAGLTAIGVQLHDFDLSDAIKTAELWQQTRSLGLSIADRACLSLAFRLNRPVMTADRNWRTLKLGFPVQLIRHS